MHIYRLNWAMRTSWGLWDKWDDPALQTQDAKFEPWRSEAEHATFRSWKLPTIDYLTKCQEETKCWQGCPQIAWSFRVHYIQLTKPMYTYILTNMLSGIYTMLVSRLIIILTIIKRFFNTYTYNIKGEYYRILQLLKVMRSRIIYMISLLSETLIAIWINWP